jgi:hypothetical protein
MWQVENRTPFAAERGWARDRNGEEVWLVALKCTFDIAPDGAVRVSEKQPPVLRVPEFHGEAGEGSMKFESDLILKKCTTDVFVVGHAYAPPATATRQLDVGFRLGALQKTLRVFGDRVWDRSGPSPPEPFVKMPIVYERAFGGADRCSQMPERDWEWRNPVGTGFAVSAANLRGVRLANFEYPNDLIVSWNDRPNPAGFGPIAAHWQPRVGFAGTYDERWMKERQPLVPQDFDERFFQAAPVDQQAPSFLRGGELVILHHLTPDGDLRFQLPRLFLGFETRFFDGSSVRHTDRKLHSVILEPDYPRVSLVWHTALPCHAKVQKLERTIVTLKQDLRVYGYDTDAEVAIDEEEGASDYEDLTDFEDIEEAEDPDKQLDEYP